MVSIKDCLPFSYEPFHTYAKVFDLHIPHLLKLGGRGVSAQLKQVSGGHDGQEGCAADQHDTTQHQGKRCDSSISVMRLLGTA